MVPPPRHPEVAVRRLSTLLAASALVLAACAESPAPQAPTGLPQAFEVAPAACITIDAARALVRAIYPTGARQNEAQNALTTIRTRLNSGNIPGAREYALIFTREVLKDFYAGVLTGGQSSATQQNVRDLVNGVFCIVGLPQPDVSLDPDAVAGVVGPTSPTTTLVTPTAFAGITVPGGAAPQLSLITVRRLPDAPTPLLTPLDQYPAFYEFTATPPLPFNQDVLVGVCQVDDIPAGDYTRFRVGHNVGTGIEILPRQVAPFLDCTALLGSAPFYPGLKGYASRGLHWMKRAVLPTPAYAALGNCCLGGTTKTFSPFGAVDPLTILTLDTPFVISGPPGSSVSIPSLPRVFLKTPTGRGVPGVTVTFTLNAGSDATISGATRTTNPNGLAELGSWTLGTDNLPDTVFVNVTPLEGSTVQGNGGFYVATP